MQQLVRLLYLDSSIQSTTFRESGRASHLVYKFDKQIVRCNNYQIKILNWFEFPHLLAAWTSKAKLQMTYWPNKTLLRDRKRWRIEQIDELDEQKCTQKIGILPGPTKSDELTELTN